MEFTTCFGLRSQATWLRKTQAWHAREPHYRPHTIHEAGHSIRRTGPLRRLDMGLTLHALPIFTTRWFDRWVVIRSLVDSSSHGHPSCCEYQPITCGYFSLWVKIDTYHYLFCHSNHSSFGHWELLQVDCWVPLTWPHHFLNASLLSERHKIFWACLLHLPCHRPGINTFSKATWFPFRKQNLEPISGL